MYHDFNLQKAVYQIYGSHDSYTEGILKDTLRYKSRKDILEKRFRVRSRQTWEYKTEDIFTKKGNGRNNAKMLGTEWREGKILYTIEWKRVDCIQVGAREGDSE
jgi:hypothetical protein